MGLTQQSIFGFTEGKFNVETVFLGNFTSLNKYILQQYTEEIEFTNFEEHIRKLMKEKGHFPVHPLAKATSEEVSKIIPYTFNKW